MTEWRFVHVGSENDKLELGGLPVWREEWRETVETVFLSDPSNPGQRYRLGVYEIGSAQSRVRFAAGEFSEGFWGFFIPADDWRYRVLEVVPGEGLSKIIVLAGATDLPAGAEVVVRLTAPDGSVVETAGVKEWEFPVDEPPFKQDAFLLPNVEEEISVGALAEVAEPERAASPQAPAVSEARPSLPSPQSAPVAGAADVGRMSAVLEESILKPAPSLGNSALGEVQPSLPFLDPAPVASIADVGTASAVIEESAPEQTINLGASAAGYVRPLLSSRERAALADIGNAGLTPVLTSPAMIEKSLEPDRGTEYLVSFGSKTIFSLWILYITSAAYILFRLKNVVFEMVGIVRMFNFFGEGLKGYEYRPFVWFGASVFYLAIVPVAILQLDRLRQIPK